MARTARLERPILAAILLGCLGVLVPRAAAEPRPIETGGFAFDLDVEVPAPPERAFDAFTRETLAWWGHHFSENPKALYFDARPGGGFVEAFDDKGNGAWHATVIYAERPKRLRFNGPLGLSGSAVDVVTSLDFEPTDRGTRVKLSVHAAGEYHKDWPAAVEGVWRHFLVERFLPYVTAHPAGTGSAASVDASNPLVATVLRYRDAKRRNDRDAQRATLATDARMWFETRDGQGSKLDAESDGDPWAGWDRFFRSEGILEAAVVTARSVRATVSETNDWYRLVDRPPSRYYMTYDFDEGGRISGVLVHSIPGEPKPHDRVDEFKTWARANRPGLLEKLMPDGKLDPALEKAKQWKVSLFEWRRAAGLGLPEGVDSGS